MQYPRILLVVGLAGAMLSSCSVARRTAAKQAAEAGKEAIKTLEGQANKTPEQKLAELYAAHPSLLAKPTRVERLVDTVRTAPVVVSTTVAPTSSPANDRALADSLVMVLQRLGAIDSTISAARRQSAAGVLAGQLNRRPTYPRDTASAVVDNVEVRAWFDAACRLHVVGRKLSEAIPVAKVIDSYEPIREPGFWEKVWFSGRITLGLLGAIGIVLLFLLIKYRPKND